MGLEILLVYMALMLFLGPGTVLFGVLIAFRQRVRLSRTKVLNGWKAIVAGTATAITGIAFTYLLWYMARYFRA